VATRITIDPAKELILKAIVNEAAVGNMYEIVDLALHEFIQKWLRDNPSSAVTILGVLQEPYLKARELYEGS